MVFTTAEQESMYDSPVLNIQFLSAKQNVTFGISAGEELEITGTSLYFFASSLVLYSHTTKQSKFVLTQSIMTKKFKNFNLK